MLIFAFSGNNKYPYRKEKDATVYSYGWFLICHFYNKIFVNLLHTLVTKCHSSDQTVSTREVVFQAKNGSNCLEVMQTRIVYRRLFRFLFVFFFPLVCYVRSTICVTV